MKTLIIMRHAKSSWDTPLTDVERPLNARGKAAASALGDWLRAQNLQPDQIMCSYAVRTMETVERLGLDVSYHPNRALYLAPSELMFDRLQEAVGETVLIVAHNPGCGDLAQDLAQAPNAHPRFADYPTGATCVLRFEIQAWSQLKLHSGAITDFVIPKELEA